MSRHPPPFPSSFSSPHSYTHKISQSKIAESLWVQTLDFKSGKIQKKKEQKKLWKRGQSIKNEIRKLLFSVKLQFFYLLILGFLSFISGKIQQRKKKEREKSNLKLVYDFIQLLHVFWDFSKWFEMLMLMNLLNLLIFGFAGSHLLFQALPCYLQFIFACI